MVVPQGIGFKKILEDGMKEMVSADMLHIKAGLTLGCALYVLESGLVSGVAGMAFGPFGAGLAFGLMMNIPGNPCQT